LRLPVVSCVLHAGFRLLLAAGAVEFQDAAAVWWMCHEARHLLQMLAATTAALGSGWFCEQQPTDVAKDCCDEGSYEEANWQVQEVCCWEQPQYCLVWVNEGLQADSMHVSAHHALQQLAMIAMK
jgi:hypothetical protein